MYHLFYPAFPRDVWLKRTSGQISNFRGIDWSRVDCKTSVFVHSNIALNHAKAKSSSSRIYCHFVTDRTPRNCGVSLADRRSKVRGQLPAVTLAYSSIYRHYITGRKTYVASDWPCTVAVLCSIYAVIYICMVHANISIDSTFRS